MIKVTALIEETSSADGIAAEHGLSLYIETHRHKILFDSGQTDAFSRNAQKLGIDLSEIDIAILSHSHYDHSGGFSQFININSKANIYANENVFKNYRADDGRYVGTDKSLKSSGRFILTGDELRIDDELYLFTANGSKREHKMGSFGLLKEQNGTLTDDDFLHEQYLKIFDDNGYVLISGCSHKGILNILDWCGSSPRALVGGFHFMKIPLDESGRRYLESVAKELLRYPTEFITCHCTGAAQYKYINSLMGSRVGYLSAGQTLLL